MITIKPTGGLCNYLRVIFSYYEYARSIISELNIIWIISEACPGYFLDYFEPIPYMNFIESIEKDVKIDYTGCGTKENFKPKYEKLKLKPYLEEIVSDKLDILNKNYISLHIRRTDHIILAKKFNKYTDDEEFINFIDTSDNNKNIYIATDNEITYNKFMTNYPNRIKFDYHNTNNNSLRKTSLQDAIIDIYMCVYSDNFKGSGWSSFSDLIKTLRLNQRMM